MSQSLAQQPRPHPNIPPRNTPHLRTRKQKLEAAFSLFTEAAGALEISYRNLQGEAARMRSELEVTNTGLRKSLDDNRSMRQYLERVLEGLPCAVVTFEKQGNLCLANPQARELIAGKNELDPSRVLEQLEAWRSELMGKGEGSTLSAKQWEWSHPNSGASERIYFAQGSALPEQNSIFILRDITQERQVQSQKETLRRNEALAGIAALLAHEVRNPLASLELFAGLLSDAVPENVDAQQWLEHIQVGLRRLSFTVNNVLQFHSAEAPGREPMPVLEVCDVLHEAVEFLAPLAKQKKQSITFTDHDPGARVTAHPHQLLQVFLNLAMNAVHAMDMDGRLSFDLPHENDEHVVVLVSDTGHGIAPTDFEQIFTPGFSTKAGSPGLGLDVCRRIICNSGGSLKVASTSSAGTVFRIELPRAATL